MKAPHACFEPEHLCAYWSHMLGVPEEAAVDAHLALCPACREVLAGFENVSRVLDEWKPVEPSPWFDARARARIASVAETPSWFSRFHGRMWAGATAAVAVAVVAISLTVSRLSRPSGSLRYRPAQQVNSVAANPSASPAATSTDATAQTQTASQEIDLYKNLKVLENYDMLANFDVLSELPQAGDKATD